MTSAAIHLYDTLIAAVTWDSKLERGFFEYDASFLSSSIEVAPLTMPLARTRYTFPELPRETFKGLPGLLADSKPPRSHVVADKKTASASSGK